MRMRLTPMWKALYNTWMKLIDGIPHAETTEGGDWPESYRVCLGDETLECGRRFSDYTIPRGATLTVIRESIERIWVAVPS